LSLIERFLILSPFYELPKCQFQLDLLIFTADAFLRQTRPTSFSPNPHDPFPLCLGCLTLRVLLELPCAPPPDPFALFFADVNFPLTPFLNFFLFFLALVVQRDTSPPPHLIPLGSSFLNLIFRVFFPPLKIVERIIPRSLTHFRHANSFDDLLSSTTWSDPFFFSFLQSCLIIPHCIPFCSLHFRFFRAIFFHWWQF